MWYRPHLIPRRTDLLQLRARRRDSAWALALLLVQTPTVQTQAHPRAERAVRMLAPRTDSAWLPAWRSDRRRWALAPVGRKPMYLPTSRVGQRATLPAALAGRRPGHRTGWVSGPGPQAAQSRRRRSQERQAQVRRMDLRAQTASEKHRPRLQMRHPLRRPCRCLSCWGVYSPRPGCTVLPPGCC